MNCKFIKSNGNVCRAKAIKNSKYCFSHNPDCTDAKKEAVIKGGLNRRSIDVYGEELNIETAKDIKNLIAKTINLVWTGKMPASSPANSIGFLARVFLDAQERSDTEERVKFLEEKIGC